MAESADAPDLKSGAPQGAYGFDPRPGHFDATHYSRTADGLTRAARAKMSFAPFYRHLDLERFGCSAEAFVYNVNVDVLGDSRIHVPK